VRKFALAVMTAGMLVGGLTTPARAASQPGGLKISPLRYFVNLPAGGTQAETLTVTNATNGPADITLTVDSFSVADYSYDYQFEGAKHDWITVDTPTIHLAKDQTQKVPFEISVPAGTPSGGQYFSILASTRIASGGISTQVQVASVLFITVTGQLVQTVNLLDSKLPSLTFTGDIVYSLNVRDTGNVHYFLYAASLETGLFTDRNSQGGAHLMMPDTAREIDGDIKTPWWPGVYKVTYGYVTDAGKSGSQIGYVLYLPPWLLIIPLAVLALRSKKLTSLIRKRRD
jgi:hypothetical protein